MKIKVLIALTVILFFEAGFLIGLFNRPIRPQESYTSPITIQEAGQILERAIYSHQYYVDNPQHIPYVAPTTTVEFHQGCIDRYNQVWDLIQRLAGDK